MAFQAVILGETAWKAIFRTDKAISSGVPYFPFGGRQ